MTRYHSSCIELIRIHSVMFQLVGLIISHYYELYLLLNSHFQVDIIKNDIDFFEWKPKIFISFFLFYWKENQSFSLQIVAWGVFPKNIFQAFFSKEKNLKNGYVDVHIWCLLSIYHYHIWCLLSIYHYYM